MSVQIQGAIRKQDLVDRLLALAAARPDWREPLIVFAIACGLHECVVIIARMDEIALGGLPAER